MTKKNKNFYRLHVWPKMTTKKTKLSPLVSLQGRCQRGGPPRLKLVPPSLAKKAKKAKNFTGGNFGQK